MPQSKDIEKIVVNEDFQAFCAGENSTEDNALQQWADNNQYDRSAVKLAKKLVDQLSLRLPASEVDAEFFNFRQAAYRQDAEKREYSMRVSSLRIRRWVAGVAAAVLVLLFAGWYIFGEVEFKEFQTTAGQMETISLPDGSEVTLNANSTLRFAEEWENDQSRKVWLDGEAFFSVSDAPAVGGPKFIVHTDKGDISVLGTEFNVNEHQQRLEVVLVEGKVNIKTANSFLQLIPGQRAWLNSDGDLELEKVDMEPYVAWKNGRLMFREMPISRVVDRLNDDFGIILNVPDDALLNKHVSANMKSGDPYALIEALAALYQLNLRSSTDSLELTLTD